MNNRCRYICKAKRKDNGEWVEGYLYITHNGEYEISRYDDELDTERITYIVIPETIGQCTGLKDKNGKPIFEGDVLYDKESGFVGTVKFNDIIASFVVVINDTTPTFYHWSWLNKGDVARSKNLKNTEVIGNEFDNPELLEVER